MASELGVQTIQHTNGTDALTIDSSGRVLQPANPKFSVRLATATSSSDYTQVSDVPFDTTDFDIGSCIAISSDVATFTAPVTGYYQFNLMVMFSDVTASGHINTYLVIDGEAHGNDTYRVIEDPQGGSLVTATTGALIYLTANQTLNPKMLVNADTTAIIRAGTRFNGFLVG